VFVRARPTRGRSRSDGLPSCLALERQTASLPDPVASQFPQKLAQRFPFALSQIAERSLEGGIEPKRNRTAYQRAR